MDMSEPWLERIAGVIGDAFRQAGADTQRMCGGFNGDAYYFSDRVYEGILEGTCAEVSVVVDPDHSDENFYIAVRHSSTNMTAEKQGTGISSLVWGESFDIARLDGQLPYLRKKLTQAIVDARALAIRLTWKLPEEEQKKKQLFDELRRRGLTA